jgi:hypothetical protein
MVKLHAFSISALCKDKWSVPRSGCFTRLAAGSKFPRQETNLDQPANRHPHYTYTELLLHPVVYSDIHMGVLWVQKHINTPLQDAGLQALLSV